VKDDDGLRLDENQVAYLIRKLRRAAAADPSRAKDVLEVLESSTREKAKDEDYETFEMARTVCELLEPERIGPIISLTCNGCRALLSKEEVEKREDFCLQCRISGT